MSIVSEIETLFASFRTKVGTVSAELESHFSNVLGLAKDEEARAEADLQARIDFLVSKGFQVIAPAPVAAPAAPAAAVALPATTSAPEA